MYREHDLWETEQSFIKLYGRWMSPELLDGSGKTSTTQSDVWAYAMTSLVKIFLRVLMLIEKNANFIIHFQLGIG